MGVIKAPLRVCQGRGRVRQQNAALIFATITFAVLASRTVAAVEYSIAHLEWATTSMRPFYEDYLSAEVSARVGYAVNFKTTSISDTDFSEIIESGKADFLNTIAEHLACFETKYNYAHVATMSVRGLGPKTGGVIVVRATDTRMQSLADLRGKIVVAGEYNGLSSYQLQASVAAASGVNILQDAQQVIFVSLLSHGSGLEMLLDGDADAVFTVDYFLYSSPHFARLRLLHVNLASITSDHPMPASTELALQPGMAALPSVPPAVVEAMRGALAEMNTSHPTLKDLEFDPWVPAAEYGWMRSLMLEQGLLRFERVVEPPQPQGAVPVREGWSCFTSQAQFYQYIQCPEGSFKLPRYRVQGGCAERGLACPAGATCVCQPCKEAKDVTLRVLSEGGGARECSKGELCAATEQRQRIEFEAVDNLLRGGARVAFRVRDAERYLEQAPAAPHGNFSYRFGWEVQAAGGLIMELFVNGHEAENSPVWIKVTPRTCPGLEEANAEGECVCGRGAWRSPVSGRCFDSLVALLPSLGGAAAAVLLGLVLHYRRRIRRSKTKLWLLDPARVLVTDPPEVLGWGSYGEVVKATYQGTEVAVKRVVGKRASGRRQGVPRLGSAELQAGAESPLARQRLSLPRGSPAAPAPASSPLQPPCGRRLSVRRGSVAASSASCPHEDLPPASPMPVVASEIPAPCGPSQPRGADGERAVGAERRRSEDHVTLHVASTLAFGAAEAADLLPKAVRRTAGSGEDSVGGTERGGFGKEGARTDSLSSRSRSHSVATASTARSPLEMEDEIRLLAALRHPNITTVMGAIKEKGGEFAMVMEFMVYGSLMDIYLNDMFALEGDVLHPIFQDIAAGMQFLHESDPPIVHGDLKSSNVLVDEKFRAKISDFGLACTTRQRGAGSALWQSPELLRGGLSSRESDVFAYGVLLSEVLCRRLPYDGEDVTVDHIADPAIRRRPHLPQNCPSTLQMVMHKCWEHDPALRLSFPTIRAILAATPVAEYPSKPRPESSGNAMVYGMFPRHVADALMRGEAVPEDRRESATVFFSDVCNFTRISEGLESHQVSAMLDRLFSAVDAAAARHGIYKVETIGDCYIGVSNLVEAQPLDHASRMAHFCLDAVAAAAATLVDPADPSKGFLTIRAGFDSGPVVGSVVGTTYKKYTIFGNTVNTASRMESTGVPGKIQCTKRAAELLQKEQRGIGEVFSVAERGAVEVKGRGTMTTFFVRTADAP